VIEDLVRKGMNYYRDFVLPNKQYRTATEDETKMLETLRDKLLQYEGDNIDEFQTIPFDVARSFNAAPKDFFKMFYEIALGQERGPRFGTFIRLVGKDRVVNLIERAIGS
jgi:lysyl-tRNA synthetase class 1